ncbi:MAG TPA: serine hydroxymethyltransferase [Candidatus Woesearchaeota archaeon]|nr:MAG: serine hydroxymethyltransferase [Candidatus Woesearchaeota archaeon]HDD70908.1 serine hydroxymethyltransferase [Candidatus Woesearchaeota archaeon]
MFDFKELKGVDSEIYDVLKNELKRQRDVIELIASENIVSKAVLQTMGSWLTNKYSEGYPNKRYYGGNEFIDQSEQLAIDRAKQLFNAEHANVQPHAGSQANFAAYMSVLNPGDTILSMSLAHGGHLTHGHPVNFSGKLFNFVHYGVNKNTELIDFDEVRRLALKYKPKMILAGASAYPRYIDFKAFRDIADEVGAYLMVDMAHIAGLVAAKVHPDPVGVADIVTTTTHKTLRGPRGALILSKIEDRFGKDGKKNLAQKIDSSVFPGMQGGPLEHIIAAKAVAFKEAMSDDFRKYQEQVIRNAKVLSEELQSYGFRVISGGTDNHLILIDVTFKNTTGKVAETALDNANICTNKNMIPFDTRSPFNPSGIRLGTAAVTSRGMKESDMKQIAYWINRIVDNVKSSSVQKAVKQEVLEFCKSFPIYDGIEL